MTRFFDNDTPRTGVAPYTDARYDCAIARVERAGIRIPLREH